MIFFGGNWRRRIRTTSWEELGNPNPLFLLTVPLRPPQVKTTGGRRRPETRAFAVFARPIRGQDRRRIATDPKLTAPIPSGRWGGQAGYPLTVWSNSNSGADDASDPAFGTVGSSPVASIGGARAAWMSGGAVGSARYSSAVGWAE